MSQLKLHYYIFWIKQKLLFIIIHVLNNKTKNYYLLLAIKKNNRQFALNPVVNIYLAIVLSSYTAFLLHQYRTS